MRTLLICLVVLAGCGKKKEATVEPPKRPTRPAPAPTPQPPPRPVLTTAPNACTVIDEAIAKVHLGDDAKQTRHSQPNPHVSQCQWVGKNGVANVLVGDWASMYTKNEKNVAVAGIGDEAYDTMDGFLVRKGEYAINVKVVVKAGMFTGAAAAAELQNEKDAEHKLAPDLVAKL
jgi:hypothetical protein